MTRKGKLLVFSLSLLMAACGQSTTPLATNPSDTPVATAPTPEADTQAMTGGKTFSETLQEPGWVQTSEGFWERTTEQGHESIYMGANGAKKALIQRQAVQAKMLETASAAERVQMQARFDAQNASLMRAANVTKATQPSFSPQSINQCTHDQSIQRLTSQPGIKASAWINYPESGYHPSAGGEAHSNQGSAQANPTQTATSASAFTSISGTSNCSAYTYSEATDFWGYQVGRQVSGSGCYGVTYNPM